MASEIELKFFITTDRWKQYEGQPTEIKQYYLPSGTTLARDDSNVTITAPGYDSVVIPVSELKSDFLDAFTKLGEEITVGDKTELRVRSKQANGQQKLTITLKQDTKDSNTRNEFESSLTNVDAFNALSGQSQGRMVGKKRYKLDKKALCDAGIISQEMYNAVGEIIVDEYDEDHHAYLQANDVPENAVLEIEFKEGTSEDDVERFKREFSQNAGFATPITDKQKKALKNKNIAAAAAEAAQEFFRQEQEKKAVLGE
jgi:CYTH domain-containing protein